MARTQIVVETCSRFDGGFQPNFVAFDGVNQMYYENAAGDAVPIIKVGNSGSTRVATAVSLDGQDGDLAVADRPHNCPINDTTYIGKHAGAYYNQAGNIVHLDIDNATDVTVAVVRFI